MEQHGKKSDKDRNDDILKDHFSSDETDFDRQLTERQLGWKSDLVPFAELQITPVPKSIAAQELFEKKESASVEDISESKSSSDEISAPEVSGAPSDASDAVEKVEPAPIYSEPDTKQADGRLKRQPIAPKPIHDYIVPKSDPAYTRQIIEQQTVTPHVRSAQSDAFPTSYITQEVKPVTPDENEDLIAVFGAEKQFLISECGTDIYKVIERIKVNQRLAARYKQQESADWSRLDELVKDGNEEDRKLARARLSDTYQRKPKTSAPKYKKPLKAVCDTCQTLKDVGWTAEKIKERLMKGNLLNPDSSHYVDTLFSPALPDSDKVAN